VPKLPTETQGRAPRYSVQDLASRLLIADGGRPTSPVDAQIGPGAVVGPKIPSTDLQKSWKAWWSSCCVTSIVKRRKSTGRAQHGCPVRMATTLAGFVGRMAPVGFVTTSCMDVDSSWRVAWPVVSPSSFSPRMCRSVVRGVNSQPGSRAMGLAWHQVSPERIMPVDRSRVHLRRCRSGPGRLSESTPSRECAAEMALTTRRKFIRL
jgi:hypothetical protein